MRKQNESLRTRLVKYFGIPVLFFGILLSIVSVQILRTQIIHRAETQVRSDLNGAWGFLNTEMEKQESVVRLTAERPMLIEMCRNGAWDNIEMRKQLEQVRVRYGLDFLTVLSTDNQVVMRSAPPYETGDYCVAEPALTQALKGEVVTGLTLMTPGQLNREHANLADRAYLVRENTPHARMTEKRDETRGMLIISAVPIMRHNVVLGVLYGAMLLNRNAALVSTIQESVFRNEKYKGVTTGSVTVFMYDCRIATTVRRNNGDVAIGTLVSGEVAERVLDNGQPWQGRAFVVKDWYLTAYDPIRDIGGKVIGMLYVGTLERPFRDMVISMIARYAALSLAGIVMTLVVAFLVASHIAHPLHALAGAADRMRKGEKPGEIICVNTSVETRTLVESFNEMARELTEREEKLREVNTSLATLNRSYMETLGFISHELKTPLGSIMNYTYLLGEARIGTLNDKQLAAVKNIDRNTKRITEMVRHYLNLSRIENNELHPILTRIEVAKDIVTNLVESFAPAIREKNMVVENGIDGALAIYADYNMTHEIFENLFSNAIKYGNQGGTISLGGRAEGETVEFKVRNTGPGISPECLERVFEKFSRDNGMEPVRKRQGTGLGLFITRHIVKVHGGTITVKSEPGKWVEFTFTLPVPTGNVQAVTTRASA